MPVTKRHLHTRTWLVGALLVALMPAAANAHESRREREERREHRHHHDHDHHDHHGADDAHRSGWTQQLGAGGGWYAPWQGNDGHQVQVSILNTSPSGHFRFGAEFVHREFQTRIFDIDDVDVDSYQGNLVFHFVMNPGHFTPYVGAGIGLHANDVSKYDIERANPALDVRDDVGLGYGAFAILGLELPLGTDLSLFAEGRLNLAYQVAGIDESAGHGYSDYYHDRVDDVITEDFGGGSAVFGARLRF